MQRKPYSKAELLSILAIERKFGLMTYRQPLGVDVEKIHFERTGVFRRAACLYMAAWRIRRGDYDPILNEGGEAA